MMRSRPGPASDVLAQCHGWRVDALDATIGRVETPLFPGASRAPDYLVLRTAGEHGWSFPIVPVGRIARVDRDGERLTLALTVEEIRRCPRRLPLA